MAGYIPTNTQKTLSWSTELEQAIELQTSVVGRVLTPCAKEVFRYQQETYKHINGFLDKDLEHDETKKNFLSKRNF